MIAVTGPDDMIISRLTLLAQQSSGAWAMAPIMGVPMGASGSFAASATWGERRDDGLRSRW